MGTLGSFLGDYTDKNSLLYALFYVKLSPNDTKLGTDFP